MDPVALDVIIALAAIVVVVVVTVLCVRRCCKKNNPYTEVQHQLDDEERIFKNVLDHQHEEHELFDMGVHGHGGHGSAGREEVEFDHQQLEQLKLLEKIGDDILESGAAVAHVAGNSTAGHGGSTAVADLDSEFDQHGNYIGDQHLNGNGPPSGSGAASPTGESSKAATGPSGSPHNATNAIAPPPDVTSSSSNSSLVNGTGQ